MHRIYLPPRADAAERAAAAGVTYGNVTDVHGVIHPYLVEHAVYEFSPEEIALVRRAADDVYRMLLEITPALLSDDHLARSGVPPASWDAVRSSWAAADVLASIGVRLDLVPVLDDTRRLVGVRFLEVNQTPTAIPETSLWQWDRVEAEYGPDVVQWNGLFEALVDTWQDRSTVLSPGTLCVCWTAEDDSGEDQTNVAYLADAARAAGLDVKLFPVEELRLRDRVGRILAPDEIATAATEGTRFVDPDGEPVRNLFVLYPWEWILGQSGAAHVLHQVRRAAPGSPLDAGPDVTVVGDITWIEPLWRAVWNKAVLPVLWERYGDSPWLLPAFFDGPRTMTSYVRKPVLSREGGSVTIVLDGVEVASNPSDYGAEGFVWQAAAPLPSFTDGPTKRPCHPVLGVWVVGDEACALGIRESDTLITDNLSRFVAHVVDGA
jgi:glutathionylspermidine synthase